MKLTRLLEITMLLLNKERLTARELAERYDVSVRTIYRDIDALSEAGIPVYTDRGNGGGISLLPEFTLQKLPLSEEEKSSIFLALQSLGTTNYPDTDSALLKLSTMFKGSSPDWVSVNFAPYGSLPHETEKFDLIRNCILKKQLLEFQYSNAKGEYSERIVEAVKLLYWGQAWYLWAFCRLRGEWRMFKIARIKNPQELPECFTPRQDADFEDMFPDYGAKLPTVSLVLRFSAAVSYRIYDYYPSEMITMDDAGRLIIQVDYPEDQWVYSHILSFGAEVEVIEPEHVRTKIAEQLKNALEIYVS